MTAVLDTSRIRLGGAATDRDAAIREVGELLVGSGAITPAYVDAMFDREQTVSTYMGNLLAIPHGTNEAKDAILESALSFVRYAEPIDWDGNPVRFVVGVAGKGNEHLEILGRIAIVFSDEDEVAALADAASPAEVLDILAEVNA